MFGLRSALAVRTVARPVIMRNVGKRAISIGPKPPIMERAPAIQRELPDPNRSRKLFWLNVPVFGVLLLASGAIIFNYQKSSASVTASTLYACRTNPKAREALGPEIGFAQYLPWIWGTVDQLHGHVEIEYKVRGKKDYGWVHFKSDRVGGRTGEFVTTVWELKMSDGRIIDLLEGAVAPL